MAKIIGPSARNRGLHLSEIVDKFVATETLTFPLPQLFSFFMIISRIQYFMNDDLRNQLTPIKKHRSVNGCIRTATTSNIVKYRMFHEDITKKI